MCLEFYLQSAKMVTSRAAFLTKKKKKKTMKAIRCPIKSKTWAYKQAASQEPCPWEVLANLSSLSHHGDVNSEMLLVYMRHFIES